MKERTFFKSDFQHLKALDRMYLHIQEAINELLAYDDEFEQFQLTFNSKLADFANNFKALCKNIKDNPTILEYFNDEISLLGNNCLNEIDQIGKYFDEHLQKFEMEKFFRNLHLNMFIDEIYY